MKWVVFFIFISLIIACSPSSADAYQAVEMDELARLIAKDIIDSFPSFTGLVLSVKADGGVYIDIGSDDGLTKGERFEVYSQGKEILQNEKGEFIGYKGDRLALIEVEWLETDYSYAKIVERYDQQDIDSNDILHYLPSQRVLYIRSLKGEAGLELTERISPALAQSKWVRLVNVEDAADYFIDGEVGKKAYGVLARIYLFKKGSDTPIKKIERRLSFAEIDITKPIIGKGYKAWRLPPNIADFIMLDHESIALLGKDRIYQALLTPSSLQIEKSFYIQQPESRILREPIGRMQLFDLDNDSSPELLESRAEFESGQFLTREDGEYSISGFLPGLPLSSFGTTHLLISEIRPEFNLFDPSKTRIITITPDGFMREQYLNLLSTPFIDAAFVDTNGDANPELAIVSPDGKLVIMNGDDGSTTTKTMLENVGMGIFQDTRKFLYTTSNSNEDDFIIKYGVENKLLIKLSQSPSVPFKIFRIRNIDSNIAALALNERNTPFLIIFDEF